MMAAPALDTLHLLARARTGDRSAWGDLAGHFSHRVKVALLADGLRLDEAQDLAQEAWASIWNKHQRGEIVDLQIPGLIIAQARFLAKDLRRRAQRAANLDPAPAGDDAPAADRQLVAAQQLQRVHLALADRSAQHQRIFRQAVEDQRPHADIAQREGLSLQRVRQILWEVRRALRSALDVETEPR